MKSQLSFILVLIFFFLPSTVLAEKSCSSLKTEEKCEESYSCQWDSKSKSCKKVSLDEEETNDPMEEPTEMDDEY